MDIIKTRFEEHIALAQQVAQSGIMQQVADAADIIKKHWQAGTRFCSAATAAAQLTASTWQPNL